MFGRALLATLCIGVSSVVSAQDAVTPLFVGDPVPPIPEVSWARGELVSSWTPGHVYLIDFWATWCPPCVKGLRHLQTLHEQLADRNVHMVAIAIWPTPTSQPPEELLERFPDLSYSIAIDIENAAADAFMPPTRSTGLPNTILIDRQGRLAWVGTPGDDLEHALAAVVEGSYDIASARRADVVRHEAENFIGEAAKAERSGDFRTAIDLIEQAIAVDPDRFSVYRGWQYEIALLRLDDGDTAREIANQVLSSSQGEDPYVLYILATRIVTNYDDTPAELRDLDLALRCATRAVQYRKSPDYDSLRLLAQVYALRGEYDGAVETQRRASDLAPEQERAAADNILQEYRKQAAAR
jgi:thiol-disulfide isomerase/thioredoxin